MYKYIYVYISKKIYIENASVWVHFVALWKIQNKMPNACNGSSIYIFFFSLRAVRECQCVSKYDSMCVCVRVLLFLTLRPSPPHSDVVARNICALVTLLQIGLNSSAATAPL